MTNLFHIFFTFFKFLRDETNHDEIHFTGHHHKLTNYETRVIRKSVVFTFHSIR